jgi:penicillin-binding protein 1C
MRDLNQTEKLELETLIDQTSLQSVLMALSEICGEKAEHVETAWHAASIAYFGREPKRLTLGEAALLVALPQSPEARRPDRSASAARRARDRILDRIADAGIFEAAEIAQAKGESVPAERRPMPWFAPHAAADAVAALPSRPVVRLTIDAAWQASLEELARERAKALGPAISVAILAVDHASGEVRARVGSADFFDERRAGQVDMTNALRSPGSTLKPFIYGLGFEDGIIHPETLIEDRPVRYGSYMPENFDLTFQGTVSVRRALQMSLNVPAVAVLDRVGAGRFTARFRQAGGALVLPQGEVPGLAIGLGGAGVRLSDLVMLYAGLARLGTMVPLVELLDLAESAEQRAVETRRLMRGAGRRKSWQCVRCTGVAAAGGATTSRSGGLGCRWYEASLRCGDVCSIARPAGSALHHDFRGRCRRWRADFLRP